MTEEPENCNRRALQEGSAISDKDLRNIYVEVLERIQAEEDKDSFFAKCDKVTDQDGEWETRPRWAYVDTVETDCKGQLCTRDHPTKLFLNPQKLLCLSRSPIRAIIAHEIAHVVLRHDRHAYGPRGYEHEIYRLVGAAARDVHEWDADLLAWKWGFSADLKALWRVETERGGRALPPPWFHRKETEAQNQ